MGDDSTDDPVTACRDGQCHSLLPPDWSLRRQGVQCSNGKDSCYLDARLLKQGEGL
jgi:hypothetical protein